MSVSVSQILVGGFDNNFSYLVTEKGTKKTAVIDPSGDVALILNSLTENNLTLESILVTHTHFDHIDGLKELLSHYPKTPIYVHPQGEATIAELTTSGLVHLYNEGDKVTIGNTTTTILYTPGHCNNAVCIYIEKENSTSSIPQLITGDTLFVEGCGRTNEQDVTLLYQSLERLKRLPEETILYPGHNYGPTPTSTIAHEKQCNRFLLATDFSSFKRLRLG